MLWIPTITASLLFFIIRFFGNQNGSPLRIPAKIREEWRGRRGVVGRLGRAGRCDQNGLRVRPTKAAPTKTKCRTELPKTCIINPTQKSYKYFTSNFLRGKNGICVQNVPLVKKKLFIDFLLINRLPKIEL